MELRNSVEWISVKDRLPEFHCIVKIKNKHGKECRAYFHADKMSWLWFYKIETSYFQEMNGKWLHDVTHWMDNND